MPAKAEKRDRAPEDVQQMGRELLRQKWHEDIKVGPGDTDADYLRLCILLAYQPMMDHGRRLGHRVKVTDLSGRLDDRRDIEIILDAEYWDGLTEPQQRAELDHCLTYIELQKDELGSIKTDDAGRPKLTLKPHDWVLRGFKSIAERHGDDAPEVREARQFQKEFGAAVLRTETLFDSSKPVSV
jgi:hypothetical protein